MSEQPIGPQDQPFEQGELDSDGDGLLDSFELAALLDPQSRDSDGDGVPDGEEDLDGDGLTNLEEAEAARGSIPADAPPNPLQPSLLVEIDIMRGRTPPLMALEQAASVFRAAGIGLHFFIDQDDLNAKTLSGGFEERHALLEAHRDFRDRVHVIFATEREDIPQRGGEVITHGEENIDRTGVFIYVDALDAAHPACGGAMQPITADEALAGTLAHELGHVLQLGHDTDVGGGTNFWNLMSVPRSCADARKRLRGEGNGESHLGAVEIDGAPRFSESAVMLMRFDQRVSIEAATFLVDDGFVM